MRQVIESNAKYHSHSGWISASGLKTIFKKSVFHHLNKQPFSSSSLTLGSAVHSALLEPENFNKEFYLIPKIDRRTKEGKQKYAEEFLAANGREIITPEDMTIIKAISEKHQKNDLSQHYCTGQVEISHYGEMDEVPIRVRPDVIGTDFISDVKTCQDNSPRAFRSDVYKYAYHLQAAFYSDALGFPVENFRFIAVETKYPYTVQVYALSDEMIEQGRNAYKSALADWKFYLDTGIEMFYKTQDTRNDGALIL